MKSASVIAAASVIAGCGVTATPMPWELDGCPITPAADGVFEALCLEWQATPATQEMNWSEAKQYCESLELPVDGSTGWRLPRKEELQDLWRVRDMLVGVGGLNDLYWSSSPVSGAAASAWFVYFANGNTRHYGVSSAYRVRCVR